MATEPNTYGKATVYINGNLLSEAISVSIQETNNLNVINTLAGKFGVSPGAAATTIDCSMGAPSADFEFEPSKFMFKKLQVVEVVVFTSGRTFRCKGFINSRNFSSEVASAAQLSFSFIGGEGTWE